MRQSLRLVSGLYLKLSLLTIAVGFLLYSPCNVRLLEPRMPLMVYEYASV